MAEEAILAPCFAALGLGDKPLKEAIRNKKIAAAWIGTSKKLISRTIVLKSALRLVVRFRR
jgi:hypothetical protein